MAKQGLLVLHGAGEGAYAADQALADRLQMDLPQMQVTYPHLPGLEQVNWAATRADLQRALDALPSGSLIVAHSLGGSALLKYLSEPAESPAIAGIWLLAAPYNLANSAWGPSDFCFPADFATRLPDVGPITLCHSRDDAFIAFDDLAKWTARIPRAR
ncbi:MAG: alpha/beta hydrolase, partial [bacterium]